MPSVVTDPGGYLNFYLNFTEVVDTIPLHRIVGYINALMFQQLRQIASHKGGKVEMLKNTDSNRNLILSG